MIMGTIDIDESDLCRKGFSLAEVAGCIHRGGHEEADSAGMGSELSNRKLEVSLPSPAHLLIGKIGVHAIEHLAVPAVKEFTRKAAPVCADFDGRLDSFRITEGGKVSTSAHEEVWMDVWGHGYSSKRKAAISWARYGLP
jgi:hypothetical protein